MGVEDGGKFGDRAAGAIIVIAPVARVVHGIAT
jgi:hypothetical protein